MTLPIPHPGSVFWGLERSIGTNGNTRWERVQIIHPEGAGGAQRWFPIASYTAENIRAACGTGVFRVLWQPKTRRAKWTPSEQFMLESEVPPAPAPPPKPTASAAPVPARPEPTAIAPRVEPFPTVPAPIHHGQPGVSGDLVGGFERLHHLASSDASQVTTAVAVLAQSFNQSVAQMAAVTIAMSGQRAQDAQHALAAIMAQQAQPNPQLAAIARQLEAQNAAIGQLAAAQVKTTEQLAELEDGDEPGPLETIQTPTDGQRLMATLAPLAIEYVPKLAARLFPEAPNGTPGDGTAPA
jgi:hypothetical protein